MTILVTGGTGLVGPRLLGRLTAAGVECRALVRPGKEVPEGVQRAEGDILSPDSLPAAVKGVTAVVHLAAVFRTRDDDQIWTVNLPFIYGDQDGHLESLPELAAGMGWHPAQRLSVVHHADIATAFALALTGAFDNRTVNIADESPLSIYEMSQIVGYSYSSSAEPLNQPWKGQMDTSLARGLGFTPTISTIHAAVRNGAL